jgi:PAS domain S-box-containing protein
LPEKGRLFKRDNRMRDQDREKKQLIDELAELHRRLSELETRENEGRRVQEGLRESESRYRSLFDHIPVGLYRTTPKGQIVDANLALVQMLGYPDRESLGAINAADAYLDPQSRVQWQTIMERDGVVRNFETQLRRADGSVVWTQEDSRVVRDGEGRVLFYEGSFQDITERKRVEEALRESEIKYRSIFENVQDVFYQADQEGKILEISPSIERYSGYTRTELIGKPVGEAYWDPEDRMRLLRVLAEKGEVVDYEVRLKAKDHRMVYASVDAHILIDPAGRPIGVEGSLRDITEQKRAEEELRKSEERFKDLYDNAPVGYHEYDTEGRITRVNRTDLEMLGYVREEMIGRPVWEFNVETEVAREQILEKLAGSRPPGRGLERTYKRKDGTTFPVLIEDRLLLDEKKRIIGIRCTIQDITERKEAEEVLARQNRELAILNETKDRFLGIAAHDLRNPLTIVKVSTSLLQGRTTKSVREIILNNIARSTEKMLGLIDNFLDVSKIKSGKLEIKLEDVEVSEFLKGCYDQNEMIGRLKGIALVMSVSEGIGYARFDKERMHQAVDNLLSNAFKYSNPNTTVTLGARRSEAGLAIWVEDQGVGIKDGDLPLLFAEFSRASAQPTAGESSHGLGLAIVKRVVELQGGRIEARSGPAGGAIFTITLP